MSDKVVKILTNKLLHCVVSFILVALIIWQEIALGTDKSVWLGMIFAAVFGLFYEFIRWIAQRNGFKPLSILPWLVGGAIACLVMSFV